MACKPIWSRIDDVAHDPVRPPFHLASLRGVQSLIPRGGLYYQLSTLPR